MFPFFDAIGSSSNLRSLLEPTTNKFIFNRRFVCYKFRQKSFALSHDLQQSVKGTPLSPTQRTAQHVSGTNKCKQRDAIVCFLEGLVESTGDSMPDKYEQNLPYFQKVQVYDLFQEEFMKLYTEKAPSKIYFYETWRAQCFSIKVRKVHRLPNAKIVNM